MGDDSEESTKSSFKSLGLCDELVNAVGELQWKAPTAVQAQAIPHALAGRDLIALSQTGSGKTGAFALPILHALIQNPKHFSVLVLSPTRELAIQIRQHFEALGSSMNVKSAVLIGGLDMVAESVALSGRPHIIVATPGRLLHHLRDTKGFTLRAVKYLVLDEADRLLGTEFQKSTDEILKSLPRGGERITYLFSATMTNKVKQVERACLRNPVKIQLAPNKYTTVDTVQQHICLVPYKHKVCYLVYILSKKCHYTTMVFTQQRASADFLAYTLRNLGFRAIPLHGDMSQQKRLGALNMFKSGQCNVLVCTNVASRGLDIPSVDLVINYDIPEDSEDYVHRIGRTARAGRSGAAITFLSSEPEAERHTEIESDIGKKLLVFPVPADEALQLQESVREAKRLANSKLNERGSKKRKCRVNHECEDIAELLSNQLNGNSKKMFNKRFKKW